MATPITQFHSQLDVKLDGINYREWSIFVKMLFDSLDLMRQIDGSSPPSTASDEKTIVDWIAATRQARGIISQSVAINIRMGMCSMWTTQEMWYNFEAITSSPVMLSSMWTKQEMCCISSIVHYLLRRVHCSGVLRLHAVSVASTRHNGEAIVFHLCRLYLLREARPYS